MAADVGNQIVTIRFARPVDSDIVNKRFKDIRPLGIYKGGYLTMTGGDNVSLSPLVCEIRDGDSANDHQVRIETTIAVVKTLLEAAPYLVLTWAYTGVEDTDYMVITTSSLPDENDLIIAKGIFVASALSSIEYTERTTPSTHDLFLRVEESETPSSIVRIRAGVGHGASVHSAIVDRPLTISGVSSGETVYIFINDSGGVTYSKVAAIYAGKALLAKIVWPADNIIENSDIEDVRTFITPPAIPDGETIERDTDGKLKVKYDTDDFEVDDSKLVLKNPWINGIFGTRTPLDSVGNAFSNNAVYRVTSDGFVTAEISVATKHMYAYTDGNNPPTTRTHRASAAHASQGNPEGNFTVPVRIGDYWRITGNPENIKWLPVGTGVCVKQ